MPITYGYDNEGLMTSMATPNATYTYTNDGMGRPIGMTGTAVVSGVTYNAADQILTMNHDGLAETRTYNERLQLTRMTIPGQMDLEYRYSATQNNGQITSMKNWINSEEVTYTYDALGRLSSAVTTGPEWGLSFTFDGFGNKTAQTVSKGSGPTMSIGVDSANHVVGHTYDANGNTTSLPGVSSMTWDAQGRMMTAAVSSQADAFSYNASNERVLRLPAGASTSQFFLRGIDGRVLSVYTFNSASVTFTFQKRFSYFAGKRVGVKEDRLATVQNGAGFIHMARNRRLRHRMLISMRLTGGMGIRGLIMRSIGITHRGWGGS